MNKNITLRFSNQIVLTLLLLLSCINTIAATNSTPNGTGAFGPIDVAPDNMGGLQVQLTAEPSAVHFPSKLSDGSTLIQFGTSHGLITGITNKTGAADTSKFIVLFADGTFRIFGLGYDGPSHELYYYFIKEGQTSNLTVPTGGVSELKGDDLYVLKGGYLGVSHDTGITWQFDTVGLGSNGGVGAFDLDTGQNVYCISSKLYFQTKTGNTWATVNAFPSAATGLTSIYIDKKNRIFVTCNTGVYIGTNNGANWTNNITTIGGMNDVGEDSFGNIYATNGFKAYRSSDGGLNWTRIDTGITNHNKDTTLLSIIHHIAGGSVLYATTVWGVFKSTDQGTTWMESNKDIGSTPRGFWRYNNGDEVATTDLGCFIKRASDSVWTHTYPNGYLRMDKLFGDSSGNLYTMLHYNGIYCPIKSIDRGHTWAADSAGFVSSTYAANNGSFYVDETGTHHISVNNSGTNQIQSKIPGGSYTPDTTGFGGNFGQSFWFASDHNGYFYTSGGGSVSNWRRPIRGTTWVPDTVGMGSPFNKIDFLVYDQNGSVAGINWVNDKIYHRFGGHWNILPYPPGTHISYFSPSTIIGDSSGGISVYFYQYSFTSNFTIPGGVFCTHDNGTTWNSVGLDTNIVGIANSTANGIWNFGGDTSYVATNNQLYKMTCNGVIIPTGIKETVNSNASVRLFPNPASNSAVIAVEEKLIGSMVYVADFTGRIVWSKRIEVKQTTIPLQDFEAGMYFVNLSSAQQKSTLHLIITK